MIALLTPKSVVAYSVSSDCAQEISQWCPSLSQNSDTELIVDCLDSYWDKLSQNCKQAIEYFKAHHNDHHNGHLPKKVTAIYIGVGAAFGCLFMLWCCAIIYYSRNHRNRIDDYELLEDEIEGEFFVGESDTPIDLPSNPNLVPRAEDELHSPRNLIVQIPAMETEESEVEGSR